MKNGASGRGIEQEEGRRDEGPKLHEKGEQGPQKTNEKGRIATCFRADSNLARSAGGGAWGRQEAEGK